MRIWSNWGGRAALAALAVFPFIGVASPASAEAGPGDTGGSGMPADIAKCTQPAGWLDELLKMVGAAISQPGSPSVQGVTKAGGLDVPKLLGDIKLLDGTNVLDITKVVDTSKEPPTQVFDLGNPLGVLDIGKLLDTTKLLGGADLLDTKVLDVSKPQETTKVLDVGKVLDTTKVLDVNTLLNAPTSLDGPKALDLTDVLDTTKVLDVTKALDTTNSLNGGAVTDPAETLNSIKEAAGGAVKDVKSVLIDASPDAASAQCAVYSERSFGSINIGLFHIKIPAPQNQQLLSIGMPGCAVKTPASRCAPGLQTGERRR